MAKKFTMPRYIVWPLRLLAGAILCAVVALAGAVWWLSGDAGKTYTQHFITSELSQSAGYLIEVEHLSFAFPLTANFSKLVLSDSKGAWLQAQNVSVHILPTPSIQKHLVIRKIKADSLHLIRNPEPATGSDTNDGGMDVSVMNAEIKDLLLAPQISGLAETLEMTVQGKLGWDAESSRVTFKTASQVRRGLAALDAAEIELGGNYALKEDTVSLEKIIFTHPKLALSGNGVIRLTDETIAGIIKAESIDLARWLPSLQGKASGELNLSGSLSQPAVAAHLTADHLRYETQPLPDAQIEITGLSKENAWQGTLKMEAEKTAKGEARYVWSGNELTLRDMTASYADNSAKGNLAINTDTWVGKGKVTVAIPNIESFSGQLPFAVKGRADIAATLSAAGDTQSADLTVDLKNIATPYNKPSSATIHAGFTDIFARQSDTMKVNFALDVAGISKLLLPPGHVLKGNAKVSLALGNSLSGTIALTDGTYDYLDLGVKLRRIRATLTGQNNSFVLKDFHAEDAKGHALTGEGTASMLPIRYQAAFGGKSLALFHHPNLRGALSADVTLEGDETSGKLKGTIKTAGLEIYLPDRFAGNVPELNVVKTIPSKKGRAARKNAHENYALMLDAQIEAENKVFIRGWGVDAELQGKLALTGTAANPEIEGKLSTIRGRYEEFGKQFKIKQGELLFEGDMPPSPYLTVVASVQADGAEIRPVLSGPLLEPSLKVESSPSLPQEEALSLLLFGKDSKKISAFQAAQLANSLRKLSGHGDSGFDPLGKIRQLVGVDDIAVRNEGENGADTSVGVGKYVGDNVYIEVQRGADATSGKARVEVEMTPSISVESSTGAAGSSSVGVNWKHDY